jgi:hypothetical protein
MKGVSVLTLIAAVVLGLAGLVILWLFLQKSMPFISEVINNIIKGIVCKFGGC